MARIASVAVGGYYPTPTALLPIIAAHLDLPEGGQCFLDPCAGEGEAVYRIATLLRGNDLKDDTQVYGIEMEQTRHQALVSRAEETSGWRGKQRSIHADAFRVTFSKDYGHKGATVLYLNPPYDLDPAHGRLEERFLSRFTPLLTSGGVLVFVVPFYALKASAATLATYYRDLQCFRFPGALFDTFKQVVLFASHTGHGLDETIQAQVEQWAADATTIPELGVPETTFRAHPQGKDDAGFSQTQVNALDVQGLQRAFRPWTQTDKTGRQVGQENVIPSSAINDLLNRTYPLAMPPKAAHIATGIAAGIFNGSTIVPDDPTSGLPRLLIKGCFDKEWRKVEEKVNKKGEVTSQTQVQAPKLVVTVLDLSTQTFHTLRSGTEPTLSRDISTMSTMDLLAHYGGSLMNVLLKQCPVDYDPADPGQHFPLPTMGRSLYRAQEHVTRALINQLGGPNLPLRRRYHKSALLLGEIGSGKSFISLAAMKAIKAKSTLILCPPHLLTSWGEQIAYAIPEASYRVLTSIEDLLAYVGEVTDKPRFAVLSRETAKLGHARKGVERYCPACHGPLLEPEKIALKRTTCPHRAWIPENDTARLAVKLAPRFSLLGGGLLAILPHAYTRRMKHKEPTPEQIKAQVRAAGESEILIEVLAHLISLGAATYNHEVSEKLAEAILQFGLLLPEDARERLVYTLWANNEERYYGGLQSTALLLALSLPSEKALEIAAFFEEHPAKSLYSSHPVPYGRILKRAAENLSQGLLPTDGLKENAHLFSKWSPLPKGGYGWLGHAPRTVDMARGGLAVFLKLCAWERGPVCGEPLYQSDEESFRRVPLADFIAKRYAHAFDSLILDEIQEYATEGSAQERAAHLLTEVGWPTLMLTGTTSNGYASSLFSNTWATDRVFRGEFDRNELAPFMDRYGYRKRVVQDKDKETGDVVAFGTVTDRVERSARMTGYAPGVLPLFVFKYLLKRACVIHKTDARGDIPELTETYVEIEPTAAQMGAYDQLLHALVQQMKRDMFQPDLSGKLFGALAELPSYLDRCARGVGNQESGEYEIRYPEEVGGALVAQGKSFDPLDLLPKERWMISQLQADLAAGENVLIFAWHVNVLPRLKMFVERDIAGVVAPILDPSRVPTAKRQAWIEKEVVQKGRRVMICNPMTVQTGLNNLVHFSRIYIMQNPACNPIMYRQAIGRIDRIGQTRPTQVYFPTYKGTLQEALHRLLMLKVAVSRATDGLDAEGALSAAGAGDAETLASLSVGRALAEWIKTREVPLPREH